MNVSNIVSAVTNTSSGGGGGTGGGGSGGKPVPTDSTTSLSGRLMAAGGITGCKVRAVRGLLEGAAGGCQALTGSDHLQPQALMLIPARKTHQSPPGLL